MKKDLKIPFSNTRQLTWYSQNDVEKNRVKLVDNYEFRATLVYVGFSRGRSALNIEWLDRSSGITYQSGMSLLNNALTGGSTISTTSLGMLEITDCFTFKKQGTSYLLTFAGE